MLTTQLKRIKDKQSVPEHLKEKYNQIRSIMNFADLAITYSVDANDYLNSLFSVPMVLEKKDHSLDFVSLTTIKQTFEFEAFKLHVKHHTLVTLNDAKGTKLGLNQDETLVSEFTIEWNDGLVEDLTSHIGLSLYHYISLHSHRLQPSSLQIDQLKDQLLYGLCVKLDKKPSEIREALYLTFMNNIQAYEED